MEWNEARIKLNERKHKEHRNTWFVSSLSFLSFVLIKLQAETTERVNLIKRKKGEKKKNQNLDVK